jgi:DNA-binding NarL/FixJ family response regulator
MLTLDHITSRQRDVALGISKGYTYQEIADSLYLSKATVRNCATSLIKRLGICDGRKNIQIARWVWEQEHEINCCGQ